MRKILNPLSVILAGAIASSLVATTALAESTIYVQSAPPQVRNEVRGRSPGSGYVWVGGYYRWRGGRYVWVPGHWVRPPHHSGVWVPGHWVHGRRGWRWVNGYWRR